MEKFLTNKMKDRLKDEQLDLAKQQKRDKSNVLLSWNLDKIVQEENKTNSSQSQVRMALHDEHHRFLTSDHISSGVEEALWQGGLRQEYEL